jgi:hypothetical protein
MRSAPIDDARMTGDASDARRQTRRFSTALESRIGESKMAPETVGKVRNGIETGEFAPVAVSRRD